MSDADDRKESQLIISEALAEKIICIFSEDLKSIENLDAEEKVEVIFNTLKIILMSGATYFFQVEYRKELINIFCNNLKRSIDE